MIKKYDDNYIKLESIDAVTKIDIIPEDGFSLSAFDVIVGNKIIHFEDQDYGRIRALRERLIKDWMEVANAN
ncbi:MAG: hypothetical protein GXO16_05835 [Epsilonproteobacteria bacterium]|nr:hypothetical protein [Campylobacterota bacterium]